VNRLIFGADFFYYNRNAFCVAERTPERLQADIRRLDRTTGNC